VNFAAMLDRSSLGTLATTYILATSDEDLPGATGLASLTLQLTARVAIGGDATLDDVVNLADFNVLAANFGSGDATWTTADFNRDGAVNQRRGPGGDAAGLGATWAIGARTTAWRCRRGGSNGIEPVATSAFLMTPDNSVPRRPGMIYGAPDVQGRTSRTPIPPVEFDGRFGSRRGHHPRARTDQWYVDRPFER
jgi:hypothetical protein